jgi:hypothetical protein
MTVANGHITGRGNAGNLIWSARCGESESQAPAFDSAVRKNDTAEIGLGVDHNGISKTRNFYRTEGAQDMTADANLPPSVVTPAPHCVVGKHGAGVFAARCHGQTIRNFIDGYRNGRIP